MEFNYDPHQYFRPFGERFPDITVFFGGLGLIGIRPDATGKQHWSGDFVDHLSDHILSAYVFEYKQGKMRKSKYQLGWVIGPDGRNTRTIELSIPASPDQLTGMYTASDQNDSRDIAQIGNFWGPELHDKPIKLDRTEAKFTSISVSGGIAYTAKLADSGDDTPDQYYFRKPDGTSGPERTLGNWLGIANDCDRARKWTFRINGSSMDFGFDEEATYCVVIGNMCDEDDKACSSQIDFKYFYKKFEGIVDEPPVELFWSQSKNIDRNFRVACNFMLSTDTVES